MKKLTLFEASCIITGYGIGSGVLAMPYLADKCGVWMTALILALAFGFSWLLHMMIADLAIKSGGDGQIVSILTGYLPEGKSRKPLRILLFSILAVVLFTNLAVYISGAAEILNGLLALPVWTGKFLFYVFAAFVAIFGVKTLGLCEKYAMYGIFAVILALVIGSVFHIKNPLNMIPGSFRDLLAFFSVAMFAFVAFFSVPQVVKGLDGDVRNIKRSITLGMLMNLTIMILVILSAQLSSEELTEVSMTGWSRGIGLWAQILGSGFTLLAMLTTYWSISMALKDIVAESLPVNAKLCFVIASVPSLLIAFIPSTGFLSFLELAAGAIAILIAIFLIPVFHKSHKDSPSMLGKAASLPMEVLVFLAYIGMAAGSLM